MTPSELKTLPKCDLMKRILWIPAFLLLSLLLFTRHPAFASAAQSETGQARLPARQALIGTKAKTWKVGHWFNSDPLRLEDLKGHVVLVRFWTAPGCPFCAASAPALNEFYENYHHRGLEVVGFYHHKAFSPLDPEEVEAYAKTFGFRFPIAIDENWTTLRDWWLDDGEQGWTSVTFLIDKQGVIRHIHPGGQYVKGDKEYTILKNKIEALL